MASILFVTLLSLLTTESCQLQCVQETLNESEFSIHTAKHIQVESGDCIEMYYRLTIPKNKVKVPYKKIWFRGDPQNTVSVTDVQDDKNGNKFRSKLAGEPRGEYEYGFKLEWGCNQTYVFPTRVQVSVSELTKKPTVRGGPLKEGETSELTCDAPRLCKIKSTIDWMSEFTSGKTELSYFKVHMWQDSLVLSVTPLGDDHIIGNITCVVEYENNIVTTKTVTLTMRFAPKFQNGTQCVVKGELLVCVCIAWGNPPSSITWPVASLTDFSITSYSSGLTVNSTLIMKAADTNNSSIKCISSNELGQREREIEIGNYTENPVSSNVQQTSNVAPIWATAVGLSVSLNMALLACLIICIYKRSKSSQEKLPEEMDTYASLNRAEVEPEYSVISPKPR